MSPLFADILLPLPLSQPFTYAIPHHLRDRVEVGSRVLVPFKSREQTGLIVSLKGQPADKGEIKDIIDVLDPYPIFDAHMLEFTRWIAAYYLCPWGTVLRSALPVGLFIESRRRVVLKSAPTKGFMGSPLQEAICKQLSERGSLTFDQLSRAVGRRGLYTAVYDLERQGVVEVRSERESQKVNIKTERVAYLSVPREDLDTTATALERRAPKQAACLRALWERGGQAPLTELEAQWRIGGHTVKALAQKGLVEIRSEEKLRDPFQDMPTEPPVPLSLTPAQTQAVETARRAIESGTFQAILLHGITGSGKTQVYIETLTHALQRGRGAIVLIPEIALTPQTVRRFRAHFGDRIAVLHSALSNGERYDAWRTIQRGDRPIVIGARSAIFAPVKNLGLIVVDEEHEPTYKQYDTNPRYHARDVAAVRAKMANAVLLLGSATPSLESYHNAQIGKFHFVRLPQRIGSHPLPQVEIVDMRQEKERGNWGIFSKLLTDKIHDRLTKDEQIILLQNRRGYSTFLLCPDCGFALRCDHCRVTLTYHAAGRWMICHYCGYRRQAPDICPACGSHRLKYRGIGTERIEDELARQFPQAKVIRMDLDTTGTKGAHHRLLEQFRLRKAHILLGTQMVAKGLDFPGVTLVGVISADTALNLPDFRAGERTFNLLTQVAGRSGRGATPGEVVIQSHSPDDPAIQFAQYHDFEGFARWEMENRKALRYPPYGRLILFLFRGKEEPAVQAIAESYGQAFKNQAQENAIDLLGPVEAPLSKIRGYHRWHLMLRGSSRRTLRDLALTVHTEQGAEAKRAKVIVSIDVDPIGML